MDNVKLVRNGVEKMWPVKDLARLKVQGWNEMTTVDPIRPELDPVEEVEEPRHMGRREGNRK